ncbi:hypothetical protein QTP86_008526 [Hemibagrus guttatus]|nr:hypothetical protein QTP86_008526 [Hemibagrus guttatus]
MISLQLSYRTSPSSSTSFSSTPELMQLVQQEIKAPPGMVVRQQPYRVPEARRHVIEEEVEYMLREESTSPWSSPIVVVPKPDGTLWLCNDFWKLNQISEFYSYPLP